MGEKSLVALDTDHIKQYVFATNKLKEIRGASSILDHLNRIVMVEIGKIFNAKPVYTNGGSGMFLVEGDEDDAKRFGERLQREYQAATDSGASLSFAVQEIPQLFLDEQDGKDFYTLWENERMHDVMQLLQYRLLEVKSHGNQNIEALPSHPFMRICDACGTHYAQKVDENDAGDVVEGNKRYCDVCWIKRREDNGIKHKVDMIVDERLRFHEVKSRNENPYLWERILKLLPEQYIEKGLANYANREVYRPSDFNEFQGLSGGKDYMGLVYADGNSMGRIMEELKTLANRRDVAKLVDNAIYKAMSTAIDEYLPMIPGKEQKPPMFPFDILMIGGDDVMVVTPAALALDVALTIAKKFHEETRDNDPIKGKKPGEEGYTLSVAVVLAPIKYPFGLLQDLAESTLKFSKKEGAKKWEEEQKQEKNKSQYRDTYINFMVVAGSTSHDFDKVYGQMRHKNVQVSGYTDKVNFYATLRPYSVEELEILLTAIRNGRKKSLGRTKLHQLREAVLKMNLTTSVGEGLAVLRNWRQGQREFVYNHMYRLGGRYQERHQEIEKPGTLFPRVTFPWFADGDNIYRTSLLDFVELYDFVASEEDSGAEDRSNRD